MFEIEQSAGLWSLFASAFISSTLLPGGSEALLLYLAAQAEYNPYSLWMVASLGNTLGGMTSYGLGWWVAKRFPDKALDEKKHQQALGRIRRYGSSVLLFSWLPIIGDPLCFVAGWLKLGVIASAIFIAIGKALRYAVLLMVW